MACVSDDLEERLSTGIPGLDSVLAGGFLRGAMHVITGTPGTGKTVLASQTAYEAAARGEDVIYVSLMSESHTRLLANLCNFPFFRRDWVGSRVFYVSGAAVLEQAGGLVEFVRTISREVRTRSAKVLVVDSTANIAELAGSGIAYTKLLRELSTAASLSGCTVLLLVPEPRTQGTIEQYVADSVVALEQPPSGVRGNRELSVVKSRGSSNLPGRHTFEIDERGVTVHPRREALPLLSAKERPPRTGKQGFGIAGLDAMLHGGVPSGSTTAVLGAPGSGKTLMGLHFLAEGLSAERHGVYFGLYETPERLVVKARAVGIELQSHLAAGALRIMWRQPTEQILDAMAEDLLREVEAVDASRIVIDGLDGLLQAAIHPERFPRFFVALSNELRARGVSCAITMETSLSGAHLASRAVGLSATVDNIVLLRYLELRSQLHRLISILKVRESDYDASVHEFKITSAGVSVAESCASAEALLGELAAQGSHALTATSPAGLGSSTDGIMSGGGS